MLLLFAHGAGAGTSHPWMQDWASRLGSLGRVVPFDYPYMAAGRRPPDRLPKLIEAHRVALHANRTDQQPVVLIGKSMGSRVACHLSLEEPVAAVVCLGYPLVSGRGALRDEVLTQMTTPVHFIQGSRDRMGPLETFADVRSRMRATTSLHVVDGGDHSLRVGKRALAASGRTQEGVDEAALQSIKEFLQART